MFLFQYLCGNCKRHYCNDCFAKETKLVPGENIRNCLKCRALQYPIAYKDHLKRLKVKDLQEYLRARQISMNQCKEKRDLVELILRHAEEGSNIPPSTPPSQQGRHHSQTNTQSQRTAEQQGSSTARPQPNVQPVQVVIKFLLLIKGFVPPLTKVFLRCAALVAAEIGDNTREQRK